MRIIESICLPTMLPVMLPLSAAIISLPNKIGAGAAAKAEPRAETDAMDTIASVANAVDALSVP